MYMYVLIGCDKAFSRSDKLKEHTHQHKQIKVSTVTRVAKDSSTGSVVVMTKNRSNSTSFGELLCKHCQSCRFNTKVELLTHEMLCAQVPRLVSN